MRNQAVAAFMLVWFAACGDDSSSSGGSSSDGSTSGGPSSSGPSSSGPSSSGPSSDGPTSDGPTSDGPTSDGSSSDGSADESSSGEAGGCAATEVLCGDICVDPFAGPGSCDELADCCDQVADPTAFTQCSTAQQAGAAVGGAEGEASCWTALTLHKNADAPFGCPDLPPVCDIVDQTGCGPCQKCAHLEDSEGNTRAACRPEGTIAEGESCDLDPDGDDCVGGTVCNEMGVATYDPDAPTYECVRACSDDAACDAGSFCALPFFVTGLTGVGSTYGVCVEACTSGGGCGASSTCGTLVHRYPSQGIVDAFFGCRLDEGTLADNEDCYLPGESQLPSDLQCPADSWCGYDTGSCERLCDPDHACPNGTCLTTPFLTDPVGQCI